MQSIYKQAFQSTLFIQRSHTHTSGIFTDTIDQWHGSRTADMSVLTTNHNVFVVWRTSYHFEKRKPSVRDTTIGGQQCPNTLPTICPLTHPHLVTPSTPSELSNRARRIFKWPGGTLYQTITQVPLVFFRKSNEGKQEWSTLCFVLGLHYKTSVSTHGQKLSYQTSRSKLKRLCNNGQCSLRGSSDVVGMSSQPPHTNHHTSCRCPTRWPLYCAC